MNKNSFYGFREIGKRNFQSFALEITTGCQLQCGNCYREPSKGNGLMPHDFVMKALEMARDEGFSEAVWIGGEPTIHPELPKFIQISRKYGLVPILCTNGIRLADRHYCEQIIHSNMVVVIHGLVPLATNNGMDTHVRYSGYSKKLEQAYGNLKKIRKEGIQFTVVSEAVVIKPFLPHLLNFHCWCRENDFIPFIEINRRGNNGLLNHLTVSPNDVNALFTEIQKWDQLNFPDLADQLLTPPAYGNKCTMSITGVHVKNYGINDFGGVYSCCAQNICHGDLRISTLSEILKAPGMEVFKDQDQWIAGFCRSCKYYPQCRGGCRGEAALAWGCSRASCPACWHIPENIRKNPENMLPSSCSGCPLEGNPACKPKRQI